MPLGLPPSSWDSRSSAGGGRRVSQQLGRSLIKAGWVLQALAHVAQAAEQVQACVQVVGVEILHRLESQLAAGQADTRRQPPQHLVQIVEVNLVDRALRQRRPLRSRQTTEITHHQQSHRPLLGGARAVLAA
jgi:hypothetical protein